MNAPLHRNRIPAGFTLLELLAVLAVAALLAGLALPALAGAQRRASEQRTRAELGVLATALRQWVALAGAHPAEGSVEHVSPEVAQPLRVGLAEVALHAALRGLALGEQAGSPGCFLDPWGRRYLYFPRPASRPIGWPPAGFILYSVGADGRHAPPDPLTGQWPDDAPSRAVNRDNLIWGSER